MRIRSAHAITIASSTQNYADQAVNLSSEPWGGPSAGLLAAIDEAVAARGLTRSAFLASAAREKIETQR
jgi:hypothetical protein